SNRYLKQSRRPQPRTPALSYLRSGQGAIRDAQSGMIVPELRPRADEVRAAIRPAAAVRRRPCRGICAGAGAAGLGANLGAAADIRATAHFVAGRRRSNRGLGVLHWIIALDLGRGSRLSALLAGAEALTAVTPLAAEFAVALEFAVAAEFTVTPELAV